MDKEQAIKLLEHLAWDKDNEGNCYGDALSMAIDALKAQLSQEGTTSDLISRQAAMDRFNVVRPVDPKKDEYTKGIDVGIAMCIVAVKDQPSVQPSSQWILCDERMPEEHEWMGTKKFGTTISDEVYVTFENEKGERFCKHLSFQNGELSRYDKMLMDTWFKGSKPTAWMPFPEPYKEANND